MEDRQRERGRLARSCLRDPEEVAPRHHVGNGLGLDRRWRVVAFGHERFQERRREAEIVEGRQWRSFKQG
jgi:hypothetical protein